MIKIDYIEEYLILADTLNFSRAAELAYVTQPGLSRHIAEIEEEMGAKLFERSTRHVWLTPAGEVVRDQFKGIMESYRYAKEMAGRLAADSTNTLTVNSPYFWDEDFTEPIIAAFSKKHPDSKVRIQTLEPDDAFKSVCKGRGDIAVDMMKLNVDPMVRYVPFAKERLSAAICRDNPLHGRESVKLEELAGNIFVVQELDLDDYGNYNTFTLELLARRGIRPEELHYAENVSEMGIEIRRCGGVAILPESAQKSLRTYLELIPIEDEDCEITMCLYYRMDNGNEIIPEFVKTATELFSRKI